MSKHTPGKLEFSVEPDLNSIALFIAQDGAAVATTIATMRRRRPDMGIDEVEANASRLALCWNTHDELLAALKDMLAGYEDTMNRYGHGCGDAQAAKAIIARAEKGS